MKLSDTILDDELFREITHFFVEKSSESEEGDNPEFIKFYKLSLDKVSKESVETIIQMSGSPIERIFLGSLLLGSIKWFPYGIVIHQTYKDTNSELTEFRDYLDKFFEFIEWYKMKFGSFSAIDEYLNEQVKSKKMDKAERDFINRLMFRYVYLSLKDSWHMTLQPKFPDIIINGRSIRPDLLLWMPSDTTRKYIVECDGYEFHSNKDTFISDRARDRETQRLGYSTLRFSGSEIVKNVSGVATEVLHMLESDAEVSEL
ncbi:MAG: hypothetical protein CVU71_07830 [Deltaproteobacteria bacterium HGW-Deltaproteobacteria-6]|nr:MAG: hypothetical protein CVU71_07830 [Deltaproteobacteria bacterium HGW-Deltaproteobacteria-6]PKN96678.1 MAG: hypothetical protein CVU43_19465 [Chloroflexi bacterium HGW-Chloroflexi-5]